MRNSNCSHGAKVHAAQYTLPYFLFGDQSKGVDIWKWESDGIVRLLSGNGAVALKVRGKGKSVVVQSQASYRNGRWSVVLSRTLRTRETDQDVQFERGRHIPMVFFVWNGDAGETGTQMAFSSFQNLLLMPPEEGTPMNLRIVHPRAPDTTSLNGKPVVLKGSSNPYRVDEERRHQKRFLNHLQEGASVYFGKGACFFCHGANLDGKGIYNLALSPYPTNFLDPGSGLQFQESYVFWRLAKGGLGLPTRDRRFAWRACCCVSGSCGYRPILPAFRMLFDHPMTICRART